MSSVYSKGPTLYVRYKDEECKWISEATQFRPGQEAEARCYVKRLEARIDATKEITDAAGLEPGTPVTVAQYMERWLKEREALHHASHKDEDCRLRKHSCPDSATCSWTMSSLATSATLSSTCEKAR